jgi:hypothetical protein
VLKLSVLQLLNALFKCCNSAILLREDQDGDGNEKRDGRARTVVVARKVKEQPTAKEEKHFYDDETDQKYLKKSVSWQISFPYFSK